MDVLLLTIGSHGDVHPFVGLGQRLQARGHRVRLATNEFFRGLIESAGLGFESLGEADGFLKLTQNPDVWHPRRGGPAVLGAAGEAARPVYEFIEREATPDTLVVGSSLVIGGIVAAEKLRLRYATVHLAPMCIRTCERPVALPGAPPLWWLPKWMRKKMWDGADKWFLDPHVAPPINALRAELGLSPVSRILHRYWHAPALTIGMWPKWYAPPLSDWPEQIRLAGFPLYDEADVTPLSLELSAWLDAGDAPIAFTPGSAMRFGQHFFAAAVDACRRLGKRGLLLTRHAENIPAGLPPTLRHEPFAPFGRLLPRCSGIVHHGGIGTTSQALAAGIPQLITHMAHDQPDNALLIRSLRCGDGLSASRLNGRRIAKRLDRLFRSPDVAAATHDAAQRLAKDDGLETACDLLETLQGRARPATSEVR